MFEGWSWSTPLGPLISEANTVNALNVTGFDIIIIVHYHCFTGLLSCCLSSIMFRMWNILSYFTSVFWVIILLWLWKLCLSSCVNIKSKQSTMKSDISTLHRRRLLPISKPNSITSESIHALWVKKDAAMHSFITFTNIGRFSKCFHYRFNKTHMLYLPPHFNCVTTLPCETKTLQEAPLQ